MKDLGLFNTPVINNKIDLALQELDILFNTVNTELIGNPDYGINFLQFLWKLTPNCDYLEKYIRDKIQMHTLYLNEISFEMYVDFVSDITENMYVVSFHIHEDENSPIVKTYNIK